MDKFTVAGIPGFDGEYPIDIGAFTMRELQIIKRVSGVRAGELEEAFAAGDSDVILAVAVIAVRRNEKDWQAFEALAWESEIGSLTFESVDEVAAAPLAPAPSSESEPQPDGSGNGSSDVGSDLPETTLLAIGSQV